MWHICTISRRRRFQSRSECRMSVASLCFTTPEFCLFLFHRKMPGLLKFQSRKVFSSLPSPSPPSLYSRTSAGEGVWWELHFLACVPGAPKVPLCRVVTPVPKNSFVVKKPISGLETKNSFQQLPCWKEGGLCCHDRVTMGRFLKKIWRCFWIINILRRRVI